jgi:hypothetical protein
LESALEDDISEKKIYRSVATYDSPELAPLEPVPEYYNKFSSFYTQISHDEIFAKIVQFLEQNRQEQQSNCFRVAHDDNMFYAVFGDALVQIQLYTCEGSRFVDNNLGTMVELTRHNDSSFEFIEFQSELRFVLTGERKPGLKRAPSLGSDDAVASKVDSILVDLALDDNFKTKRQAISTLAKLSRMEDYATQLLDLPCLPKLICGGLESADDLTQRSTTDLIANLLKLNSGSTLVSESLQSSILEWFDGQNSEDSNVFGQLVREQSAVSLKQALGGVVDQLPAELRRCVSL